MKYTSFSVRSLTLIAMLGALSAVLMVLEIPLPFAPAYMKFDISDLPALFAGFFLGPVSGSLTAVIKIVLKLVLKGTETAFVGEFMNLLCSLAFMLPAALCYQYRHTKSGAFWPCCWARCSRASLRSLPTSMSHCPCMYASTASPWKRSLPWRRPSIHSYTI